MNALFAERRGRTDAIIDKFTKSLGVHLGDDHTAVIGDHTTVYVTGSGGRGEMSDASDVDLFLVRKSGPPSKLNAVVLQSAILHATRECGIEEPSADGVFLEMHSADDFESMLGNADDDAKNKFTARMLLMLESRPILGTATYDTIIDRMIECYWGAPAKEHPQSFLPFAFVNDVVRYWRVVLLNHEARLREKKKEFEKQELPEAEIETRMKTERYIRSYKLRFARALTCFSAPVYLLARSAANGHIERQAMKEMIALSPLERLDAAAKITGRDDVRTSVDDMRALYAGFLEESGFKKGEMRTRFEDHAFASTLAHKGSEFGDKMFELLTALGTDSSGKPRSLYRYMLV
jgi:hypothetical protein